MSTPKRLRSRILQMSQWQYPYCRAFMRMMNVNEDAIDQMVHQAIADGVGRTAMVKLSDGRWFSFADLEAYGTIVDMILTYLPQFGEMVEVTFDNGTTIGPTG